MTPITLLTAATSQVCQERGVPFPPEAKAEFSDPHITRVAEVFAGMVLAERAAELEQEARLMRARMTRLQAERDGIALAIVERLERACGAKGMPPTLVRREFLPERPCVAHLPSDDTEGGSHD